MDSTDAYLVARCLMLAEDLRGLDDHDQDARDAADLLDLLADVLAEAEADGADGT